MRWLAALLSLLTSAIMFGPATAQDATTRPPFKVSDYPLEVRRTLSLGPVTCRDVEGGGKVEFAPDTVRKIDVNGDGRDDYVISFANTKCGEYGSVFCGTGGCMVDFLVTLPNGKLRSVFAGQVHAYEILPGRPRKVRFGIFHSYCPDSETGCFRDHRIRYKLFTPVK